MTTDTDEGVTHAVRTLNVAEELRLWVDAIDPADPIVDPSALDELAEILADAADEIERLRAAIESHRASSRLAFLNDLPRGGFDSILWSALDTHEAP
jgi:hypothetical protein